MNQFFNKGHASNFIWLTLESLVKIVVSFAITVYVIKYLGPKDFGVFSYALSIVGILYPISTLGIDAILFRNIIKDKNNEKKLMRAAFTLRFFASVFVSLMVLSVITFLHIDNDLYYVMSLLLISLILDSFLVYRMYFSAIEKSKYLSMSTIISVTISSIFKLIFILLKLNVIWFAFAVVIEKMTHVLALRKFYNDNSSPKRTEYNKDLAKSMMSDSWPLIITSFSGLLYVYADQILIEYFLDFTQVGLYAAPVKLAMFFFVIPSMVSNIIYPRIMDLYKNLSNDEYIKNLEFIYFLNFIVAFFIFLFFYFFGEQVLLLLFGKEYSLSADVLVIYSFSLIFLFFSANNNKLLMIDNLQKMMVLRNMIGLGVNIVLNIVLIPKFGIIGAAFSTVLAELVVFISYGFDKRTRYILFLQLNAIVYPISHVMNKFYNNRR
jgi:O-antigen/teichoic acid export membrane protein